MAKNRVELAIIDSDGLTKPFFWMKGTSGGFYCGSVQKDFGAHMTYHVDGNVHFRVLSDRPPNLPSELPLRKLDGIRCLLSGELRIAPKVLGELQPLKKGRANIVSVDIAKLTQGWLGWEVYLVEPNRLDLLDNLKPVRKPVKAQTITSFVPWLHLCLYDGVPPGDELGVKPEGLVSLIWHWHHSPEAICQ